MRKRKRELVFNSPHWSDTGAPVGQPVGQLTFNERQEAVGLLLNTGCWQENDRATLQGLSDRSLASLVINSEGAECREDEGEEAPTINYAAAASPRMDQALLSPPTMALIPRASGQVLDVDCEFDNGHSPTPTLNMARLASPRMVRHLRDQRAADDSPTLDWAEIASPRLVANLRRQRNLPDDTTDPMDRAGLGARGKRGDINYAGRPYAEGDVAPGGPALRPEDEEVDEGDDEDAFQDDEPRFLHREMLNVDTYPDEEEEEMETGRLSSSNPAGMQWGNRDSKPLFAVGRTFSDVILEQEEQQRQRIMQNT